MASDNSNVPPRVFAEIAADRQRVIATERATAAAAKVLPAIVRTNSDFPPGFPKASG
jgi:hypothetical protein